MLRATNAPRRIRDRAFYVGLIKKRIRQIRQKGDTDWAGMVSLNQTARKLDNLSLEVLKAISRAAGMILEAGRLHRVYGW
jgi:hypothetical protein